MGEPGLARTMARNWLALYGYYFPTEDFEQVSQTVEGRIIAPAATQSSIDGIRVYPNPTKDITTFAWKTNKNNPKPSELNVMDMNGKLILHIALMADSDTYTWDTTSMQNGIYFYTLRSATGEQIYGGKIVVQK